MKQIGIDIGGNIRRVRKEKGIGQTGFVCQCDRFPLSPSQRRFSGIDIVKIS